MSGETRTCRFCGAYFPKQVRTRGFPAPLHYCSDKCRVEADLKQRRAQYRRQRERRAAQKETT